MFFFAIFSNQSHINSEMQKKNIWSTLLTFVSVWIFFFFSETPRRRSQYYLGYESNTGQYYNNLFITEINTDFKCFFFLYKRTYYHSNLNVTINCNYYNNSNNNDNFKINSTNRSCQYRTIYKNV